MDQKKLDKYKELLLKNRTSILKELETEQENFMHNDQGDLVDIADVAINNELLNRLSDLDIEKLKLIDIALEKIDLGKYGICEGTGKPIPEPRLEALPWTPYTVEYAEIMEKTKQVKKYHAGFDEQE
jgi:DnaK suppressor protein